MPSKLTKFKIIIGLFVLQLTAGQAAAAELSTLFTTPQERQIINSNRYKNDAVKLQPNQAATIENPVQLMIQEEVTRQYKITGITVSRDGPHTVWINSTAYEDGVELDDKSKIKIIVGDEIKVRITAPDGKNYYATSGETLEFSYFARVEG